jgi:regulator of replication initiation timing
MSHVIDLAYQIIELHEENKELRMEVESLRQYKQAYLDQLDESVKHGETMMGLMLTGILNGNLVPTPSKEAQ